MWPDLSVQKHLYIASRFGSIFVWLSFTWMLHTVEKLFLLNHNTHGRHTQDYCEQYTIIRCVQRVWRSVEIKVFIQDACVSTRPETTTHHPTASSQGQVGCGKGMREWNDCWYKQAVTFLKRRLEASTPFFPLFARCSLSFPFAISEGHVLCILRNYLAKILLLKASPPTPAVSL